LNWGAFINRKAEEYIYKVPKGLSGSDNSPLARILKDFASIVKLSEERLSNVINEQKQKLL
jgi:hypothetical protein